MNESNVNLDHLMHEMDFRTGEKLCPLPLMSGNPPVPCLGHACAKWNPNYCGCCDGTNYLSLESIALHINQLTNLLLAQSNRLLEKEEH